MSSSFNLIRSIPVHDDIYYGVLDLFILLHDNLRIVTVSLYTFIDLTLTTDKLMELFQSVKNPDRAGKLGICIAACLGLPQSVIEEIKSSYQSPTQRKGAYLDVYIHQHPCSSWKKVSETLRKCDLQKQADEVENTYVRGMHVYID